MLVLPKVLELDFVEKSIECDTVKIVIASRRTVPSKGIGESDGGFWL